MSCGVHAARLDLSGAQIGEKHEEISLGHRKTEVGSEKLMSIHRKADDDDHLQLDILSLSRNICVCVFLSLYLTLELVLVVKREFI